jgi:hypothetical protein
MRTRLSWWGVAGVVAVGAMLTVAPVKASDPVGVYALVDKVVFEPNEATPKVVQVWGAFAVAVTPEHRPYPLEEGYGPAQKGFLSFTCPVGKMTQCQAEWADLKSVAGKAEVVGFGTRWNQAAPRVRAANESGAAPDVYAMNIGVVKMGRYGEYPKLMAGLKAALGRK